MNVTLTLEQYQSKSWPKWLVSRTDVQIAVEFYLSSPLLLMPGSQYMFNQKITICIVAGVETAQGT